MRASAGGVALTEWLVHAGPVRIAATSRTFRGGTLRTRPQTDAVWWEAERRYHIIARTVRSATCQRATKCVRASLSGCVGLSAGIQANAGRLVTARPIRIAATSRTFGAGAGRAEPQGLATVGLAGGYCLIAAYAITAAGLRTLRSGAIGARSSRQAAGSSAPDRLCVDTRTIRQAACLAVEARRRKADRPSRHCLAAARWVRHTHGDHVAHRVCTGSI